MYDHILVPVAVGHEGQGAAALALARKLLSPGGRVTALNVFEDTPGFVTAQIPENVLRDSRKRAADTLEKLAAEAGGEIQTVVTPGHAGRTIVDYATEHGADCIVIASHDPNLSDYLLGSTAARVVRHAHCSVHVIR